MLSLRNDAGEIMFILLCELLVFVPIVVIMIVSMWKIFKKAGLEGWECIIPFYGTYMMVTKIAGKDTNHFILHLIPLVNIYARIVTYIAVSKSFGKDEGYGFGLFFIGIIFWPLLAFSKSIQFVGPGGIAPQPTSDNSLTNNWQNPDKPAGV